MNEIIALEGKIHFDKLGSYIVGLLIIDDETSKACDDNPPLGLIAELASDLEVSEGIDTKSDWKQIKALPKTL